MTERRPIALITGASAGIGVALARTFARNGHELMLVARREHKLHALAEDLAAQGHKRPHCLGLDLERRDAVEQITAAMATFGVEPEYVVNNAGFGLLGRASDLSRTEQLAMIDLNVRVVTDLSLAFLDALQRRRGGILNVASVAAFLPGPDVAVYYASKAYVLSFSEALHREMRDRGVRVTAVCPGPVPTEWQARAGFGKPSPGVLIQSADQVAAAAYRALQKGQRVVVPGVLSHMTTLTLRFMPRWLLIDSVWRYNEKRIAGRR